MISKCCTDLVKDATCCHNCFGNTAAIDLIKVMGCYEFVACLNLICEVLGLELKDFDF